MMGGGQYRWGSGRLRLQEGGRVLLSEGWLGGVAMAMVARGRPCV